MSKKKPPAIPLRYKAGPGASYNDETAQVIGCEFENMVARGVAVTPANIVDRARPESSPLHDLLEWDDKTAAEAHRREQARRLMNTLCVVTIGNGQAKLEKAVYSVIVRTVESAERQYVPVATAQSEPAYNAQIRQQALNDLRVFLKYRPFGFPEFEPVFELAEKLSK